MLPYLSYKYPVIVSSLHKGMTNSVNPDQTAPSGAGWSGFMLFDPNWMFIFGGKYGTLRIPDGTFYHIAVSFIQALSFQIQVKIWTWTKLSFQVLYKEL